MKVSDADGVPENIKQVIVTFPDGTTTRTLVFESTVSSTEGNYWYHEFYDDLSDIPDGTYTFTVTDYNDQSATIDDDLVIDTLPIPENCQPVSGSTIEETTPEISWDSVAGAAVYKVRIYEGFDSLIHESDPQAGTTFDVPSDLLEEGKTYAYRLYAYRENYPVEEADNISVNAIFPSERPYFTVEKDMGPMDPPEIDVMVFDGCISERCKSTVAVTATDPAGGNLSYAWTAPDGGSIEIEGSGATIAFDPPAPSLEPACLPYRVTVTVTSDVSGLTTEQTADIMVKLAGDANGDSVVNIIDKVIVRNAFGSSGPNPADVDCSGVVNIIDKVIVRNQFGQSGCRCP